MGVVRTPGAVKLFVGMLSGEAGLLEESERMLCEKLGPVDVRSGVITFRWTDYYREEMGEGLLRRLVGFRDMVDPGELPGVKLWTNELEERFAGQTERKVVRPVNLDPGYVSAAKVVLATTKDYSHRVYVGEGIYAEVTLHRQKGKWEPWPWTYPDYSSQEYGAFFEEMRLDVQSRSKTRES